MRISISGTRAGTFRCGKAGGGWCEPVDEGDEAVGGGRRQPVKDAGSVAVAEHAGLVLPLEATAVVAEVLVADAFEVGPRLVSVVLAITIGETGGGTNFPTTQIRTHRAGKKHKRKLKFAYWRTGLKVSWSNLVVHWHFWTWVLLAKNKLELE